MEKKYIVDNLLANFTAELQEDETQSIETALYYTKAVLEQLGYEVVNFLV